MLNISSISDARGSFQNSGWLDRFDEDVSWEAAEFLRSNASADRIDEDEFNALLDRFAVEIVGWNEADL